MQTESYPLEAAEVGQRIKRRRAELGWSLAEVARRTGLSRAYVNALELGRSRRPGASALRRLEDVFGPLQAERAIKDQAIPRGLAQLASERQLSEGEVRLLAGLRIRGSQPQSSERWRFIYDAIVASEAMDRGKTGGIA